MRAAFDPPTKWDKWDESLTAASNLADLRKQTAGLQPVSQEMFIDCWYAALGSEGAAERSGDPEWSYKWADRTWRACLPTHHPHHFPYMVPGEAKFERVDVNNKQKDDPMPPKLAPPKPLTKTPLTEDQKFDYTIRKMFEEEKKRYVS